MIFKYPEVNPTGRPRKKLKITREDQAVVYDFLMNDISVTQASKKVGMPIASFRHFVSYVVQYWINTGLMGFTKEAKSLDDFEEREV